LLHSFPLTIFKSIDLLYYQLDEKIKFLTSLVEDILDGTEKKSISDWWLSHIESQANLFLESCGFLLGAIPENYLDVPPADFEAVKCNMQIVQNLMKVCGKPDDSKRWTNLDGFLDKVTIEVYEKVDKFISDLEFVVKCKWDEVEVEVIISDQQRDCLQKDLNYLLRMKDMDEAIKEMRRTGKMEEKKAVLSDVVPIGGLVMARFCILDCELQTIQMKWPSQFQSETSASRATSPIQGISDSSVVNAKNDTMGSKDIVISITQSYLNRRKR
jgi:hypothetical protein